MSRRAYLSCYSCPYSNILENERGERLIQCNLSNKSFRMVGGASVPKWCEIKVIHKRAE